MVDSFVRLFDTRVVAQVQVLGRWWNGLWGNWTRRWVWLELLDDGRYQVRWRGGDWSDRDGQYRTPDSMEAVDAVCRLLGADVVGDWREIPAGR